ncbi:PyrBI operon leader peptide [Enterobacter sp. FY-07]|nr:PyrBI operon leader peptide [Enterobacter sp. FY-07]
MHQSLDSQKQLRIIRDNLPGGSMVQCVRQTVLPRLKKGAGLPFSFPVAYPIHSPSIEGLFFAQSSGDNHG